MSFIIYFDLLSKGLSQSYDQSHRYGRLTRVKSCYFFYCISMRLSRFNNSGYKFGGLTRVIFLCFF